MSCAGLNFADTHHLEYTDISRVLPASRYGQDLASHYAQAWIDTYVRHDPAADVALLATSFTYLEPSSSGAWQPVVLDRDAHLWCYVCSGYDVSTATSRAVNQDLSGLGCR